MNSNGSWKPIAFSRGIMCICTEFIYRLQHLNKRVIMTYVCYEVASSFCHFIHLDLSFIIIINLSDLLKKGKSNDNCFFLARYLRIVIICSTLNMIIKYFYITDNLILALCADKWIKVNSLSKCINMYKIESCFRIKIKYISWKIQGMWSHRIRQNHRWPFFLDWSLLQNTGRNFIIRYKIHNMYL